MYYANTPKPDPKLLKWWAWKDTPEKLKERQKKELAAGVWVKSEPGASAANEAKQRGEKRKKTTEADVKQEQSEIATGRPQKRGRRS